VLGEEIFDLYNLLTKLKNIREIFNPKQKRFIVVNKDILPNKDETFELKRVHSRYISNLLRLIFIVMANNCYCEFVVEDFKRAIKHLQILIEAASQFVGSINDYVLLAILQCNFGCLLANAKKEDFALEFFARSFLTFKRFENIEISGQEKTSQLFLFSNTCSLLKYLYLLI